MSDGLPEPVPLSFIDYAGTSSRRSLETGAVLHRHGRFDYGIRLTDSDNEYRAVLWRERGAFFGCCDCRGFRFHDGPCAHLWALYRADRNGALTVYRPEDALDDPPRCPLCGTIPDELADRE